MSRRRKVLFVAALTLMTAILAITLFSENGWLELGKLHQRHAGMLQANDDLMRQNLHLFHEVQRLQDDPAYVADVVRRELGMIRADEMIFKFRSGSPPARP